MILKKAWGNLFSYPTFRNVSSHKSKLASITQESYYVFETLFTLTTEPPSVSCWDWGKCDTSWHMWHRTLMRYSLSSLVQLITSHLNKTKMPQIEIERYKNLKMWIKPCIKNSFIFIYNYCICKSLLLHLYWITQKPI